MKKLSKVLLLGTLLALVALAVVPVAAQEGGQGGIIIEGNFGGDVASMNPITASDTASTRITALMYYGFLGVDPARAVIAPDQPGALVKDWTISEDGTVYTFNLRDDLAWTDGTPVTSADVLYTWNAIVAGSQGIVDTPLSYVIDPTGASGILDVQAPDAQTLVVTFASPECTSLGNAGVLYPVPSHVLPEDMAELNDAEFNMNPSVSGGVFNFAEIRPGEQISLVYNPTYPDAELGYVNPAGFIYKNVPDQTVIVEQFLAGETNFIDGPSVSRRNDIRASGAQVYDYAGNSWDYLAFNLADPTNPQNGLDENNNVIDQGKHPLFGDVRVRKAISLAVDVNAIIDAAVFGEGERMTSVLIPTSWAYNSELPPIEYDPEAAAALLEEAGWVDGDGDGVREAAGAMYAEDGTPLQFTLYTNEGNTRRAAIGTIVQDELAQIGIQVDFQTIDFNTLLDIMDSQTFDALILGWRNGYPDDPDLTQLFTPSADVVGAGSNFTSYNNPEVTELNLQAKTVPGCDPAERAELYYQIQEIMQEDLPYLWLFTQNGMYAAGANVEGFDPFASQPFWNVDTWNVRTP
jgi:peptide/nickel transport system substrate-binding protein